jgi:hypothetical protein
MAAKLKIEKRGWNSWKRSHFSLWFQSSGSPELCLICIISISRLKERFHRKTRNISSCLIPCFCYHIISLIYKCPCICWVFFCIK